MADSKPPFSILIVGAGPAGLVLALLLAQQHIPVTVLDKSPDIDRNPRASFYSAPVIHELRRAGLMPDIMAKAFIPRGVAWRRLPDSGATTGPEEEICRIVTPNPEGDEKLVSLPLDELLPIVAGHLERCESAKVLMEYEVVGIGEEEGTAWVDVRTPEGEKRMEATYVVGCDGANSTVRKLLFEGRFPGFTWDKQIVATNVYWPGFAPLYPNGKWTSSTFLVHPTHFPMIAQIANDGMLRITYGEEAGLTAGQMRERQPWKFKQFLPGAPEPDEYRVVNFSPYKIHQRCAEAFRKGRFLLAADAAHLCNPFGGQGLTGGLVDAGNLFDCLYGIFTGKADDSILDKYSQIRIQKYKEVIDPISSGNIKRVWDPDGIEEDPFFAMMVRAQKDEEFAKSVFENMGKPDPVMHDFTQYYIGLKPVGRNLQ